ncbi:MAG TPA: phosphoglycerate mutase family protein [Candidatus Krumholzibacteria bacterium]|nr:phosphoglycerate mutase family protein [Candidatus Krumholzibacteria bacterium]
MITTRPTALLCLVLLAFASAMSGVSRAAGAETCARTTTLLVVRHADRQGSDDALTDAGRERAQVLAHVASQAAVTAIYHSDTERTRLTAAPLAAQLGITPVVLPGKDIDGLLRDILANHCGETVLVVGHSNTVPLIIKAAGGPSLPDLDETAYDDLFVVTVHPGAPGFVHLRYGAATH